MRLSEIIKQDPPKRFRMNFSCNSKPIEVKEVPSKKNFSEDPAVKEFFSALSNFTLKERIRESKLSPKRVLASRVREVGRYLSNTDRVQVEENKKIVINYLNEYIYNIVVNLMNDKTQENVNLILTLGLSALIGDLDSVRELQKVLKRTKEALITRGYIPKGYQQLMSKYYAIFFNDFITNLEDTYASEVNRGVLTGRDSFVAINKEFSAKSNDLEKLLLKIADNESYTDSDFDSIFDYLDQDKTNYKELLGDPELAKVANNYRKTKDRSGLIDYVSKINNFSLDLGLAESVYNGTGYSNDEGESESTPISEMDVISKSENMEFGIIKSSNKAYVAFCNRDGYKVKLYRIPKGLKLTSFSQLVNLPSSTLRVKSLNELVRS